ELDIFKALELLDAPDGDRTLGTDEATGLEVFAKAGRFGPYVQLGEMPEGTGKAKKVKPEDKPHTASLFKTMTLERLTFEDAMQLLSLPRVVGLDPADGAEIVAMNGRYGPYIKKDFVDEKGAVKSESRSLETEEQLFDVTLEKALEILATPKQRRGQTSAAPLRELGVDPVSEKAMVIKDGRFGPYVTDGETNASLRKGDEIETITDERASELLQIRRDAGPSKKKAAKKKAPAKKKAAKKKAPAKKKAAAKKTPAKEAAVAPDDDAPF
ncbi:MAG: topoisomerase C-terminal repeat-containing protein, partial [Aquihabitans sp.]